MTGSYFSSAHLGDHHFPVICPHYQKPLAVLLVIICARYAATASSSQKSAVANLYLSPTPNASPEDVTFFRNSEQQIRAQIHGFSEEEMRLEEKLTRIKRSNGSSFFYPFQKTDLGNQVFVWTPAERESKNGINGVFVVNNSGGQGMGGQQKGNPFGWMNGVFFLLRKIADGSLSKAKPWHYYAMVVYARKDEEGMVLEWDRWYDFLGKGLTSRKAAAKATPLKSIIAHSAILCAYGTCSCRACKVCDNAPSEWSLGQPVRALNKAYKTTLLQNTKMIFGSTQLRSGNKSQNQNAFASTKTSGKKGGHSKAQALSSKGSSFAEAAGKGQDSSAVAASKGKIDAVSESKSGTGKSKAISISDSGFAQSGAEAEGGDVESIAVKTGKGAAKDYDDYSDLEEDNPEEEMDAESIFHETEQAFRLAEARTTFVKFLAKGDISADMCLKEEKMVIEMDRLELGNIMQIYQQDESGNENLQKRRKVQGRKLMQYRDPLRFGVDVDTGVNESVYLSSQLKGGDLKREKCCQLTGKGDKTEIMELISVMGQHCGGLLQELVDSVSKTKVADNPALKLMQTKKLSPTQHRDLVPLILLHAFKQGEEIAKTLGAIKELFGNSTGDKVTVASGLLVNAAWYTMGHLKQHKIKILRGLSENAQSVWTGTLLEYKMCGSKEKAKGHGKKEKGDKESECSDEYKQRLESEMGLALGTFLFMKYVDVRFTVMGDDDEAGAEKAFVQFLHLHNLNIAKQVYCKAKRVMKEKGKE